MIFWKWTNGEKYEKTQIPLKAETDKHTHTNNAELFFAKESKRECIDGKLLHRSLMPQIGLNPFLQNYKP